MRRLLETSRGLKICISDNNPPEDIWRRILPLLDDNQKFLARNWIPAWFNVLPQGKWSGPTNCLVALDADDTPLGLAPFARQSYGPLRFHSLGGYYFPYRTLLLAKGRQDEITDGFVAAMRQAGWWGARFGPLLSSDPSAKSLLRALSSAGWQLLQRKSGDEYVVELPTTVEIFRHTYMSANLRSNTGRKTRRFQRDGTVRLETYNKLAPDAWKKVIDDMACIERKSWVGKSDGHLHFDSSANARFWREHLLDPAASKTTSAFVVYFNNQPVAFEFCFDSGSTRYFIAGLHDNAVNQYSPGYWLMQTMLEDAILKGLTSVNLGQGDAGYKSRFGAKALATLSDCVALAPTMLSWPAAHAWRSLNTIRSGRRTASSGGTASDTAQC